MCIRALNFKRLTRAAANNKEHYRGNNEQNNGFSHIISFLKVSDPFSLNGRLFLYKQDTKRTGKTQAKNAI